MSKYLVIVESPTKARTISSILGKNYEVVSSMGHIVDLPSRKIGVDVENDFLPSYRVIKGKEKLVAQLRKKAKNKDIIYLATDPDREGEAISWHIQQELLKKKREKKKTTKKTTKKKTVAKEKVFCRVTFHEITKDALEEAFASTTTLDINKVNAQIARRVLDRIVGYSLSPLLWKKIVRGLSAGRVQSVALNFIVQREEEIQNFIPKTTYSIDASFKAGESKFCAKLTKYKGKKIIFESKEEAQKCADELMKETYSVKEITKKETKRRPLPPYTTSLLQQDAFSKLRYSSQKTMMVAQKLYEGIQIDEESVGLITYMRTDSFHVSPKAKSEAKDFITNSFGENYLPEKDHKYKEKKGAQLAHEAIRPTKVSRMPERMAHFLTLDEEKMYNLIWRRFIASFMKEALYENTKAFLLSKSAEFTAEGRKLIFDGFLKITGKKEEDTEEENALPALTKGQQPSLEKLNIVEHTTKPAPHFNDASLVKLLEEKGIGRPSTYAPTIFTLLKRNYINREKGYFVSTELGVNVDKILVKHFPDIIDENFTASMEEQLDEVEEGNIEWKKILIDFYPAFKDNVDKAATLIKKTDVLSDKICPQCGAPLVIKWSRRGKFLSCQKFPECRYAESITTDTTCPDCKEGKLIERRNKRGQYFYGCSKFPDCRYTSRKLPDEQTTDKTNEN
jgi:DNA topoisomerase-1